MYLFSQQHHYNMWLALLIFLMVHFQANGFGEGSNGDNNVEQPELSNTTNSSHSIWSPRPTQKKFYEASDSALALIDGKGQPQKGISSNVNDDEEQFFWTLIWWVLIAVAIIVLIALLICLCRKSRKKPPQKVRKTKKPTSKCNVSKKNALPTQSKSQKQSKEVGVQNDDQLEKSLLHTPSNNLTTESPPSQIKSIISIPSVRLPSEVDTKTEQIQPLKMESLKVPPPKSCSRGRRLTNSPISSKETILAPISDSGKSQTFKAKKGQ